MSKTLRLRFVVAVIALAFLSSVSPLSAQSCSPWQWASPRPQGNALQGAAFGAGRFVAVGRAGAILSSVDGLTWTAEASNTADELRDVAWSGSTFVAVGAGGSVHVSSDG